MDHATAERIWRELQRSSQQALRRDLVTKAVRYARIRVDWLLADPAGRDALELTRTLAHNALIDACNILCRAMLRAGEEIGWRNELGDGRRRIGDFGCHLHAILGIAGR